MMQNTTNEFLAALNGQNGELDTWLENNNEAEVRAHVLALVNAEQEKHANAISLAYGFLWHVNTEPMAPIPSYSPEAASYEARKVLRGLMTHEQRGDAINRVQKLLGHNAEDQALE